VIVELIHKLVDRQDLAPAEARTAMEAIMSGQVPEAQIAAFLVGLRMKGTTSKELVAFANVMREKAEPFWSENVLAVADTCGTGGAKRAGAFNISTAAAFVVAGSGIRVAKHGNRSATRCGSADVMEALGVNIQMPTDRLRAAVSEVGIGFLFAQRFHLAMKHVAPVRAQLKLHTVFNVLGPLSNPAAAKYQVVGVFSPDLQVLMAHALEGLGVEHSFVVHGADGIDEISITGWTYIKEMRRGELKAYAISPEEFGIAPASAEDLRGGDAATNAAIVESVLRGEKGARRDVVLLNAAAAIVAGGAAENIREGIRVAAHSIDSGQAHRKLSALREWK
jgi:anthranilate phosphoribosyltransferase